MGKIALVILGIILLIALVLGGWVMGNYNSLVGMKQKVDAQWSQVENQMQRRADLIPNVVATVKGYAKLEESVYTKIAEARSQLLSTLQNPNATPEEKNAADNKLAQTLREANLGGGILGTGGRFLQIAENYPQLKSDQQFMRLNDELAGTENRLAVARKDYGDEVLQYNTQRAKFPTILIANLLGFPEKPYFKAEEGARTAPKVDFSK
jgi:LemA protein